MVLICTTARFGFEDRSGKIDPDKDLDGVDVLMISALINEVPRGYEIGRLAKGTTPISLP